MFLLRSNEVSFITHDSVLKLNDIRTVSVNRILYQHSGSIPLSSDTYKKIEELVLQKYFPGFMYNFTQMKEKLTTLENNLKENKSHLEALTSENEELKNQINALNNFHHTLA